MAARLDLCDLTLSISDSERRFELQVRDLTLKAGEAVGLSGPSGTGKTLLLEVIGLLRRPDPGGRFDLSGAVSVDLHSMWSQPSAAARAPQLRGDLFGFVPQSGGLLPFLSVAENIALSQQICDRLDAAWQGELEHRLGLRDLRHLRPDALSIGQRQRVAIARALAHRPPFVIADEPTAALDPENALNAMTLLVNAALEGGSAVLISSHDVGLLDRIDRRLTLQIAEGSDTGTVTSILRQQELAA